MFTPEAAAILKALHQHHEARNSIQSFIATHKILADHRVISGISGQDMAKIFADRGCQLLTSEELEHLVPFLYSTRKSSSKSYEELHEQIESRIKHFYIEETMTSGLELGRLEKPSGNFDAELIVILHMQTRKSTERLERDSPSPFWDPASFTIKLLESKGLSPNFMFGYDIHWRAEPRLSKNGICSSSIWTTKVKRLHDELSSWMFASLPAHFALVGGSCTQQHVREFIAASSMYRQSLELPIAETHMHLEVDLVFHQHHLSSRLVPMPFGRRY
ncbi:hypothetical protein EV356DRAFT_537618 [Viridothelium virens]|uniref:Uncharacterized protein n=1 Tax=Viridothelium virens TaxID=1048519 RepID=A0A6A6GUP7_VIRVR|nr:hypothetical protein EV356DRAFT_537618 [Viridothelium virens]